MNGRQKKKTEQQLIFLSLRASVTNLDTNLFPSGKKKPQYKVRVRRIPIHDSIAVYRNNNLKVEVRADEGNHTRPHFHVKVKQQEVSIALDNFEVLAGSLEKKYMKSVLAWAEDNVELLKTTWEQFHGAVVQVA